ncbi:MAG TPA: hypothetical protein VEF76_11560 [Patescibacteria group bacterium]|nr:hypothetical protein [Patescibacteria group bacterium]
MLIGAFYAGLVLVADRAMHLRGGFNIALLVSMAIMALVIVVGTFKVDPNSRFHIPLKPLTILLGFIAGAGLLYAFLGNMPGQRNAMQTLADAKALPPAVQAPLDGFVGWSARHSLIGNEATPAAK